MESHSSPLGSEPVSHAHLLVNEKRMAAVEVRSRRRDVSRMQQGHGHEAMADHERHYRSLLLGEC
jgi:hypothetical protein